MGITRDDFSKEVMDSNFGTEKPSYYAIIPAIVRYDNSISASEKLMYGELTCLTNKLGYCYASNSYFAKLYGKDASTISRWVKNLEDRGYITIDYERNGKQIIRRIIKMVHLPSVVLENCNEGIEILQGGYCKNVKENITSNNITSNNNTYAEEKPKKTRKVFTTTYEQILDICVKFNFVGMNKNAGEMADWFCSVALNEDGTVNYKGNSVKNYAGLVSILRGVDVGGRRYAKSNVKGRSTVNEGYF